MSAVRRHGLAYGWLLIMVMSLAAFAVTYAVILDPLQQLLQIGAANTSTQRVAQGRQYARLAIDWAPLVILTGACVALLGRAIYESALPGA